MAATVTTVNLAEYLRTSYRPDFEYVCGELKQKPPATMLHGIVQAILGSWFRDHRKDWGIVVASNVRTQVDENHVRLPDIVVVRTGGGRPKTLVQAPLLAIEILSHDDSYADLRERAGDLRRMGVKNVWLLDPERRVAEVWTGTHWQPVAGSQLIAVNAPVSLDLEWLWAEMDDE